MAVGLTPEDDGPAPQGAQKSDREPPPGAMAGVQGDHVLAAANGLDIDDLEHSRQMEFVRVFDRPRLAERIPARPGEILALPAVEHGPPLLRAEYHATWLKELQTIILRRVMRGRELNATDRVTLPDQDSHGW